MAPSSSALGDMLDFHKQIGFYAQYHNNKINQLIHMVFVPTILWTVLVWLTYTGPLVDLPFLPAWLPANAALLVGVVYNAYYIALEPVAGTLYVPFMAMLLYTANDVAKADNAVIITAAVHVASWVFQFLGHGYAEGRKPALIDNIVQALVLAPLFVWIEMLFQLGYKPELAKKIDTDAKAAIKKWKNSQAVQQKLQKEPAK